MRVGILSYPMLFQHDSARCSQLRALLAAFEQLPASSAFGKADVRLLDPLRDNLDDVDLIHVFGAADGNHALVEAAAACGLPVVLTPWLAGGWDRAGGVRARLAERLLGCLFGDVAGGVGTSYGQVRAALRRATVVVAASRAERVALAEAFEVAPGRLRLVPPGIEARWFEADAALFRECTGVRGEFALMAGAIDPCNDQLGMARLLAEMALPLVVVGGAATGEAAYLARLSAMPAVHVLGELAAQPRLRASAFAAANVLIAPPSTADGAQLVSAALAAGTAVLTAAAGPDDDADSYGIVRVRWEDSRQRKAAIVGLLEHPPVRERLRAQVRHLAFDRIAARLIHCYADAFDLHGPVRNVYTGTASVRTLVERAAR